MLILEYGYNIAIHYCLVMTSTPFTALVVYEKFCNFRISHEKTAMPFNGKYPVRSKIVIDSKMLEQVSRI